MSSGKIHINSILMELTGVVISHKPLLQSELHQHNEGDFNSI